jgi:hypothetical protein
MRWREDWRLISGRPLLSTVGTRWLVQLPPRQSLLGVRAFDDRLQAALVFHFEI